MGAPPLPPPRPPRPCASAPRLGTSTSGCRVKIAWNPQNAHSDSCNGPSPSPCASMVGLLPACFLAQEAFEISGLGLCCEIQGVPGDRST